MELEESDQDCLALDITNRIRVKVRKSLMKSYNKPIKQPDLQRIEKALFQQYYDKIDEDVILLADNDDISDMEALFGELNNFSDGLDNWGEPNAMENDFTMEEMLDMPVMGDEIGEPKLLAGKELEPNYLGEADNESHDKSNHGIFCVNGKAPELIDIDDLY